MARVQPPTRPQPDAGEYYVTGVDAFEPGTVLVYWPEVDLEVSYPAPVDGAGNFLTGAALDRWAADRHAADVAPRLADTKPRTPLMNVLGNKRAIDLSGRP